MVILIKCRLTGTILMSTLTRMIARNPNEMIMNHATFGAAISHIWMELTGCMEVSCDAGMGATGFVVHCKHCSVLQV